MQSFACLLRSKPHRDYRIYTKENIYRIAACVIAEFRLMTPEWGPDFIFASLQHFGTIPVSHDLSNLRLVRGSRCLAHLHLWKPLLLLHHPFQKWVQGISTELHLFTYAKVQRTTLQADVSWQSRIDLGRWFMKQRTPDITEDKGYIYKTL